MEIGTHAFPVYRKRMLAEAGEPSDPIERMLIEQLTLAHFSIGKLRIRRSCVVNTPKMALTYSGSATRLLGKFRRCTLATEDFRGKRAARTERRDSVPHDSSAALDKVNGHARPTGVGNEKTPVGAT